MLSKIVDLWILKQKIQVENSLNRYASLLKDEDFTVFYVIWNSLSHHSVVCSEFLISMKRIFWRQWRFMLSAWAWSSQNRDWEVACFIWEGVLHTQWSFSRLAILVMHVYWCNIRWIGWRTPLAYPRSISNVFPLKFWYMLQNLNKWWNTFRSLSPLRSHWENRLFFNFLLDVSC